MRIEIPNPISHSSPSQVRTARRCLQRWWAEKVAGIKVPGTVDTELGNDAHKVLETHLLGDKLLEMPGFVNHPRWIKARSVLEPALYLFPPGGSVKRHFVETPIKIDTLIMPVIGFIDLVERGQEALWCVTDLKTIGDLAYAVEEDELRRDPQCTIYTEALFRELTYLKTAEFRHVYAQKKAPGAKERRIVVTRGEIQDRWGGVEETLKVQKQYSQCKDMKDVPGNRDACNDYRGCYFRNICPTKKSIALNIFQKPAVQFDFSKQAPPPPDEVLPAFEPKNENVISTEDTMGLLDVFGSEEERKAAIEKVVANGMPRENAEKLNHAALKAMAAQCDDPVNPSDSTDETPIPETDNDGDEEGEDDDEKDEGEAPAMPEPGNPKPEKMHWKAASLRYAELLGITFEDARARIKAGGWSTEDVTLEIRRLEAGKAPAPTKPPDPDMIVEVVTAKGDVHEMRIDSTGTLARIPSIKHEQKHVGNSPLSFFLDAIKKSVETKLGTTIIFRQPGDPQPKHNDPVPTHKDPVPAAPKPEPKAPDPKPTHNDPDPKKRLEGRKKLYEIAAGDIAVSIYDGVPKTVSYTYQGEFIVRQFPPDTTTVVFVRAIKDHPRGGSPVDLDTPKPDPFKHVDDDLADWEKEPFTKPPENMPARKTSEEAKPPEQPSAQAPAVALTPEMMPTPTKTDKADCIIYLDCSPSWEHTRLDEIILSYQALVEYENAVHYYGAIPFGKGPGLVANEVQKAVVAGQFKWPKHLVINTWMPGAWSVYEVLARHCMGVVRGKI